MNKGIFCLVLGVLFILPSVSAYTFLNIYIEDDGSATFLGETDENLNLPGGVRISNGNIIGTTNVLTSKIGEIWSVSYTLQGAEINLVLPEGAVIQTISNGEIYVDNNLISVYFVNSSSVSYKIDENLIEGETNRNIPLALILLAFIMLVIIFLMNYSKREKPEVLDKSKNVVENKTDKLSVVEKLLNEREKRIVSELKKTGKVKQSQLRKLTEIPKASFSRHVQELEKKKLVKRSGEGKNKFVELVK